MRPVGIVVPLRPAAEDARRREHRDHQPSGAQAPVSHLPRGAPRGLLGFVLGVAVALTCLAAVVFFAPLIVRSALREEDRP